MSLDIKTFHEWLKRHEEAAKTELGGVVLVVEAHPDVWYFISDVLFWRSEAVVLTPYTTGAVELRETLRLDDDKRVLRELRVYVNYARPEKVPVEVTVYACRLFKKACSFFGVRLEPVKCDLDYEAKLSDEDLLMQRRRLDELLAKLRELVQSLPELESKIREVEEYFWNLLRTYGSKYILGKIEKKQRKEPIESFVCTLFSLLAEREIYGENSEKFKVSFEKAYRRWGITKNLLHYVLANLEEVKEKKRQLEELLRKRRIIEELRPIVEYLYGGHFKAYDLAELGLI